MPRVTDNEVKAVVDTQRDTVPFINSANLIVDEELASKGMTANRLKQIELYLAAHLVVLTEEKGGVIKKSTGEAFEAYAGKFTTGFNMTRYGQHAIGLDTSGTLATLASTNLSAEFRVV